MFYLNIQVNFPLTYAVYVVALGGHKICGCYDKFVIHKFCWSKIPSIIYNPTSKLPSMEDKTLEHVQCILLGCDCYTNLPAVTVG